MATHTRFRYPEDVTLRSLINEKITTYKMPNADSSTPERTYTVKTYTVLPVNKRGTIVRFGSDDETYLNYPALVKLVPRGCSDLFIDDFFITALRGPEKFDGTSVIDDDDNPLKDPVTVNPGYNTVIPDIDVSESESKSTTDINVTVDQALSDPLLEGADSMLPMKKIQQWEYQSVLEVTTQEKANGKFAIFQLIQINNVWYLFGGSKNMHVLHPLNTPVAGKDLHYQILAAIQNCIMAVSKLRDQDVDDTVTPVNPTSDILTNLIGKTIIGEYVDGMHLVYTDKPYMVFFNCPTLGENVELLPKQNKWLSSTQLTTIRNMTGIEGAVIYYRNTVTNEVYRQKHKTIWYILWRAIREKLTIMKRSVTPLSTVIRVLQLRVNVLSKSYVKLNPNQLNKVFRMIETFINWFQTTTYDYGDVGPFSEVGMAKILHEFNVEMDARYSKVDDSDQVITPTVDPVVPALDRLILDSDKLTNQHPKTFLHNPNLYDLVLKAADTGFNITVIMAGPSGSGKSSVARALSHDLADHKHTCSIHSTDSKFMVDGKYVFDHKKLSLHHNQNLQEFCKSTAQVRICDNTNLKRNDMQGYINFASENSNLILILSTAVPVDVSALLRNVHGLDLKTLQTMVKKYKPYVPSYYGIFPSRSSVRDITPANIPIEQKTPLHITCKFVGGNVANDQPLSEELLGTIVAFEVLGISEHDAGYALVTRSELGGNHITLTTKPGFKPVDVGTRITSENTKLFDAPVTLTGMYLPFY